MIHVEGELKKNVPLSAFTTWRIGGEAECLYKPNSILDLSQALNQLPASMPVMCLGLGSNTLIRDGGVKGLVVLTQGRLSNLEMKEGKIFVDAGVSCASMARFCARQGFANAEFWAGIPGTMGGALRMNAGCYGGETWDNLSAVYTINRQGELNRRLPQSFEISYRHVGGLASDEWFVSAEFSLPQGDKADSLNKIKALLSQRNQAQPTGEYNCGSVFRNPENTHAAKLIESCGLKGFRLGGAEVSQKHANFIINTGNASASDIEELILHIQNTVCDKTGYSLKEEVKIIGEKITK